MNLKFFSRNNRMEVLVQEFINSSISSLSRKYPVVIRNICDINLMKFLAGKGLSYSKKELKKAKELAKKYILSMGYKPKNVQYSYYCGNWILEFVLDKKDL